MKKNLFYYLFAVICTIGLFTSCSDDEPYLADVLVKLKLIEPLWEDYTTESDTMCWLEREPPLKDKLRVLKEMGYDLSILKLEI